MGHRLARRGRTLARTGRAAVERALTGAPTVDVEEPGFDLRVFAGGKQNPANTNFNKFIRGIDLDENFIENLNQKISETDDIVLLKNVWDDILAFNPNPNDIVSAFGDTITERTQELADITPSDSGVSEFKLAQRGLKEKEKIEDLSAKQRTQVEEFAETFGLKGRELGEILAGKEETARGRLADILTEQGTSLFESTRAGRLENLQTGGFGTSESAIARAEAEAIGGLESQRLGRLAGFDVESLRRGQQFETGLFAAEEDILGGGFESFIGGNQEALDRELGLKLAGLERGFSESDAARFQSFQSNQNNRNRRQGTLNALLSGGFNIASSFVDPLSRFQFGGRRERVSGFGGFGGGG